MEITIYKLGLIVKLFIGFTILLICVGLIYSLYFFIKSKFNKAKELVSDFKYFYKIENGENYQEKCRFLIFEARISKFTMYGNQNLVRNGTYHFVPGQTVYMSATQQNKTNYTRVIGIHRTGKIRSFHIQDIDLDYVKIIPIEKPSPLTINWIKLNNIAYIYESKERVTIVNKLLGNNKMYGSTHIETINFDNELQRAKTILENFKVLLIDGNISYIKDNYISFPVKVYVTTEIIKENGRKPYRPYKMVDEADFVLFEHDIFAEDIVKDVLSITEDLLCPKNRFMFISIFKFQFSNSRCKIRSIDISPRYENKEFILPT